MKNARFDDWFLLCCVTLALGCASGTVPTTGSLLITIPVPETALLIFPAGAMRFTVTCDGDAVAEGKLEIAGEDVTDTGATVSLWQALVEGLRPGACQMAVVARDDAGEVICVSNETISIIAGEIAESRVPLVCVIGS